MYTWGADGLVSERLLTGTPYSLWYHFGPQGETRQFTDSSGTVADTYYYTAYGEPVASTGSDRNPYQYGGQFGYYTGPDTGLVLCGARWYNPYTARWMTRDPIGYAGGENLYAYCADRPVVLCDRTGTSVDSVTSTMRQAFLQGGIRGMMEAVQYQIWANGVVRAYTYIAAMLAHPRVQAILRNAVRGLRFTERVGATRLPNCDQYAGKVAGALGQHFADLEEVQVQTFEMAAKDPKATIALQQGGSFAHHTFVQYGNQIIDTLTGTKPQAFSDWVLRFKYVNNVQDFNKLFKLVERR